MKDRVGKINNDWSLLSKYRNEIFGLSIIGVIIAPFGKNILFESNIINTLKPENI